MVSTEVATTTNHAGGSTLVISPDQTFWTDAQVRVLNQLGVKDAEPGDLAVLFHQAVRTGLDPFLRQIYMIGRKGKDSDGKYVTKQTIQTGIDGFRLIARRAADKAGETLSYEDTVWCGRDGVWRDVWVDPSPPTAARVTVLRNGNRFPATVHWAEYVQQSPMWQKMGCNQLGKCAESAALRKAFPQDLSGLYTDDEIGAHQVVDAAPAPRRRVTAADITRRTPDVTQEPEPAQDEPAPEPAQDVTTAPEAITPRELKYMHTIFSNKGFADRDDRLAYIKTFHGIDVESTKDLTSAEAQTIVNALRDLPS